MKPATHITDFRDGSLAGGVAVAAPLGSPADSADLDALPPEEAGPAAAAPSRWRDFYELTKPRMNFLVVVTTMVGYYMATAAGEALDWLRLLHTVVGTALTAAGASVLNQYVERGYDALMPRTARRPLPGGRVAPVEALSLGVGFGLAGVLYLFARVNPLTAALGAITLTSYVFVYTPMKRWTTLCTIVGAVPGAIPPVMGWAAARDALSVEALVLFGILFLWQMPHFLAIAILYKNDYAAGGFKMLPVVDADLRATGRQIVVYGLALIPMSLMPVGLRMAGLPYFFGAILLGLGFSTFGLLCALGKRRSDARKLFFVSILYLPLLLGLLMAAKV